MGLSGIGADVRVRLTPRVGVGIRWLAAIGGEVTRGYPPVIDARLAYLSVGRRGDVSVDIDWIEFVR